jgi:hypothetical protein
MENNKKLIDLGILSEDEQSGVKKVSLVEEPAIQLDFRYFGKQYGFVKPSAGESQDEFISRCIPVLLKEGKPDVQAAAICYSSWEQSFAVNMPHYTADGKLYEGPTHKDASGRLMTGATHTAESEYLYHEDEFDIDTSGLAPYVAPYIIKKNGKAEEPITKAILMEECVIDYSWTKDAYIVETMLALAAELGTKEADLAKLFTQQFSNPSAGGSGTSVSAVMNQGDKKLYLYKYEGQVGTNSRDFCVGMVGLDNFYTKAQIQAMSDIAVNAGFGINGASTYSIWSFKGGPNCKHRWIQYLVTMPNGQIQIEVVKDAAGRAGVRPFDMPKRGYYNKEAFKFASEDQMILVGPAMIPNVSIPRIDENGEKYFVRFSPETIKEICMKYMKEGRTSDVNTDHEENSAGAYIYESWIVESEDDKANTVYGYDVPVGTWMLSMKVDDKATWKRIKDGELKGFSIEGILVDMEELENKKKYEKIKKILS